MEDGKYGKPIKEETKCFSTRLREILKNLSEKRKIESREFRCESFIRPEIGDGFSLYDIFSWYL